MFQYTSIDASWSSDNRRFLGWGDHKDDTCEKDGPSESGSGKVQVSRVSIKMLPLRRNCPRSLEPNVVGKDQLSGDVGVWLRL